MKIRTHRLRAPSLSSGAADFAHQQCVVIEGALNAHTVRTAFSFLAGFMADDEQLRQHPFDPVRRLGYTPAGVESNQRDPQNKDWNRHMFDFSPELDLGESSIRSLHCQAVEACRMALTLLEQGKEPVLQKLPEGGHTLRAAQYLLDCTTPQDELFGEHRDFSFLTAFIGNDMPGLEICVQGEWCPVELGAGDVLVGAGTPLRQFCPEAQPLRHRIMGGVDFRLSAFLFFELDDDVILPKSGERYGDMTRRLLKDIRVQMA